jgi:hypothetical protein
VSNIYNNNKASNAKIGQNVNKAVYFFARFFFGNGSFHPWKSVNFSIQQKVLCDALMMD